MLMKIFLLVILSIGIGESLIPVGRFAHSTALVDKRIYFFGGESPPKVFDQILYLDVSKPFNTINPPFEEIPNASIPFGSSLATVILNPQKDIIYLFGGIYIDLDFVCVKNLSPLLYRELLLVFEPTEHSEIHPGEFLELGVG